MVWKVLVESKGYRFVNYFKRKKDALNHAKINRAGRKRADKNVTVRVKWVKSEPKKVRMRKRLKRGRMHE